MFHVEHSGDVRVAVEAEAVADQPKVVLGGLGVEDVLVDRVSRAPVDELGPEPFGPLRKFPQPVQLLRVQPRDGPAHRRSGVRVEPPEHRGIGAGAVVVADQRQPAAAADVIQAAAGIGTVADDVAQANHLLDAFLGRQVAKHRLQGGPVGMDVGNQRHPHLRRATGPVLADSARPMDATA
jgi:hypothetical protein